MKKIIAFIKYQYNSIYNTISFWYYKIEANRLHKLTGKRYHIIPNNKNRLTIVDNTFINQYNKNVKGKGKKITINELLKWSYYSTSVKGTVRK